MQEFVVFDFDGTLTTKDTFVEFAKFSVGRRRAFAILLRYAPMLVAARLRLADNGRVKQRVFAALYGGMKYSRFERLGQEFVPQIAAFENIDVVSVLKKYVGSGIPVAVVSASVDEWVRPWCEEHGVHLVACTAAEVDNDRLTGRFSSPNCYGQEKVRRLRQLLPPGQDVRLTVYGDSRGDRDLMSLADRAVWVLTGRK